MCYKIYVLSFPDGKVYIGTTRAKKAEYRWNNGKGYHKNQLVYEAIQKFGWDNVKRVVLLEGLSREEAEKSEIDLISRYQSTDGKYGYNVSFGGTSKGRFNEETRKRISEAHLGKTVTPETRKKQSESLKGIPRTVEWKGKISLGNKGKVHTKAQNKFVSDLKSKEVICVESGDRFKNAKEAAHYLGFHNRGTNIQNVVNRNDRTAYGFHWRYEG